MMHFDNVFSNETNRRETEIDCVDNNAVVKTARIVCPIYLRADGSYDSDTTIGYKLLFELSTVADGHITSSQMLLLTRKGAKDLIAPILDWLKATEQGKQGGTD